MYIENLGVAGSNTQVSKLAPPRCDQRKGNPMREYTTDAEFGFDIEEFGSSNTTEGILATTCCCCCCA